MDTESQYSYSLTTFSPQGKLIQIEYALEAVNRGTSSIGIKAVNGVVIASAKKIAPLVDESTVERISKITENIGAVYSGLSPDFRVIVKKARKEAEKYKMKFNEEPSAQTLAAFIGSLMQEYTQAGGVRPMGCSTLICGYGRNKKQTSISSNDTNSSSSSSSSSIKEEDNDTTNNNNDYSNDSIELYQIDPSGSFYPWKATSIGKDSATTKAFLEKRYRSDFELDDAIHTAILTIKENYDGVLTENGVDVGIIGYRTKGEYEPFHVLTPDEIKLYMYENE